jgi:hypothetical protein
MRVSNWLDRLRMHAVEPLSPLIRGPHSTLRNPHPAAMPPHRSHPLPYRERGTSAFSGKDGSGAAAPFFRWREKVPAGG